MVQDTRHTARTVWVPKASRRGALTGTAGVATIVVVLMLIVGVVVWRGGAEGAADSNATDTVVVNRGDFDITVPTSGELQARKQIEIRNQLETRAVITEIVEEGETVQQGDVLLRLNDEDVRNRIQDAEDNVNAAESELVAARSNLEIKKSERDSAVRQAELDVELAQIALDVWQEEAKTRLEQLEMAVETAREDYERLEKRLENSRKLYEQEFISADELARDKISFMQAKAALMQAENDLKVYEQYTYEKEKKQNESNLTQAKEELERTKKRFEAEIERAQANLENKQSVLESRQERLADLQEQLEHCTVQAPTDGLVVYASSLDERGWRGDDPPEVGTELSRNRLVMVLPDTSEMVASVKVNEALSGLIEKGQRATIVPDAMPDTTIQGRVLSVGVLAESGGWRDPNRRDYTVKVLLDNHQGLGLKPSMRCQSTIFVEQVTDVVHVPIQAVFREGDGPFVYVPFKNGYAPRSVELGRASELHIEILSGLDEGEVVLLREPDPSRIIERQSSDDDGAQLASSSRTG